MNNERPTMRPVPPPAVDFVIPGLNLYLVFSPEGDQLMFSAIDRNRAFRWHRDHGALVSRLPLYTDKPLEAST